MYGYVYLTEHLPTGKVYVGQRKGGFDPDYTGSGKLIKRAVAKHGAAEFKVFFLQAADDRNHLNDLERLYINETRELRAPKAVYNLADGGNGGKTCEFSPMKGRRHSDETKRLMSIARTGEKNAMFGVRLSGPLNPRFGIVVSEETKRRMKLGHEARRISGIVHGNKGAVRSPETRAKISAAKKGHVSRSGWKMTEEQKRKISESRKAKFASGYRMVYSEETRRKISDGRKRYWAALKGGAKN